MKISKVGAEFFSCGRTDTRDGQTDGHDEANSCYSQFFCTRRKMVEDFSVFCEQLFVLYVRN